MTYEGIINPLNLQDILVNYLAGSMEIFVGLALILFAGLAAKFRLTNIAFLMMMALFIILMGGETLYILTIFIIGIVLYLVVAKMIKT